MGDSDESAFWDEKEGYFTSQDFQTANQSIYDEDSGGSKMIRLPPESDHQEGDEESSSQSSPLGLTLRKTPSFLNLLQRSLSKGKHSDSDKDKPGRKMDDLGSPEKLKASNFPAVLIKIGSWERMTRHEGDLTAKLYYAKRKLVWEVLDGALKSKIEMQWSDISAMRAITPDNIPGTLEIELNQPPLFYREINPQPRKHTLWQQASDFTGGQAPIWRRHYVRFPPGVLDKHYEKLLQCDPRLCALSEKPFPSHESPYFDPTMFGISQLSLIFNNYQYPYSPPVPASWSSHQPNVGVAANEHLVGAAASSNYEALDAQPHYINAPDFNPNVSAHWMMPPQHYPNVNDDETLLTNNSLPPYFLPGNNPTSGHFF